MDIEKPKGRWTVDLRFENDKCPLLFFPANETACRLLELEEDRSCCIENCYRHTRGSFTEE